MKRILAYTIALILSAGLSAQEREYIWKAGMMPDPQQHQIAAMTDVSRTEGFNPDKYRIPYLEWYDAPSPEVRNGSCIILISGGGYYSCCDLVPVRRWREAMTAAGVQCVNFVYRTPRPVGLPFWKTAWEDGQRAVRMVRSEAKKRGFDPERIGIISMSAGSHLGLLLATSSQTPAYDAVDKIDKVPCNINWAILHAPAYVTTDGLGVPSARQGYGPDVKLDSIFKFDAKTCPICMNHGGKDIYSPNASTLIYRQLRKMGIPAELHLYANKPHGVYGIERGVEFLRQMGFLGPVGRGENILSRYTDDGDILEMVHEEIWPEGKTPNFQENQRVPYIEWFIPKNLKTTAIQIIYSGGGYNGNDPNGAEVAPARRYLNSLGMAVVTMKYRTPRPSAESGLAKHTAAWQDLQRAVRMVRSEAVSRGLDPNRIGIMGSSAGGHLTVMGCTSARHQAYQAIDDLDKLPCNVQWGVGIYPAYILSDGIDNQNTEGGNDDSAVICQDFSFDLDTAPMLFVHGDADGYASMGSVKLWERMRAMGIQSELHTLALRPHCFQFTSVPGTGSYTYLERISEFLQGQGILAADD